MADDKSKRGPADRTRINIHELYEVEYWSQHFAVSPDRLRQLVRDHGVNVKDIEAAIRSAFK